MDVHGVLDAGAVRRSFLVRRQRPEADHPVVGIDGDDRGEGARSCRDPILLVGQRPRHQVEGGHGMQHFVVVDRPDRLGIGERGEAEVDGGHEDVRVPRARLRPNPRWASGPAELARNRVVARSSPPL
jgi:hypothetical protein